MTTEPTENVFTLLAKPLQEAVKERGFSVPTEPQRRAIPLILEGKNVLLIAPTATGKTEAAFLPILNNLITTPERPQGVAVIYITPLRALNRDLLERLEWWCKRLDVKVAVRHGDTEVSERSRQARSPPEVLITTPETLQAILPGKLMRRHLRAVKWVIIDEIHELASDKRGSQLVLGLERLRWIVERDFQVVGLSATIGSPDRVAKFLVGMRSCEIVKVSIARDIKLQILYPKPSSEDYELAAKLYTHPEVAARLRVIRDMIEKHNSVLLFTNTRSVAEVLASRFKVWDLNFPVSIHHGSLAKPSRVMAEKGLKSGKLKGLVCTSSLELGIDVGRIDLVVQYNSPRQVTRLVQRVGRSGHRIGRIPKGVVVTLDSDDTLEAMVIARRAMADDLEPVFIPEKPYDALTHQLVGLIIQKGRWHFLEVLKLFKSTYPYRDLDEVDLEKVLTYMHNRFPRLAWLSAEDQVFLRPKKTKDLYEYYFGNLSMIPDEKQFLVVDEASESPIGVLDEAFVAEFGEPGVKFIVRGSAWKILSIHEDKVYVKAVEDPTGAIPSWVGEEIPVPFDVAMEVGGIRRFVEERLKAGSTRDQIASELSTRYPAARSVIGDAISEILDQIAQGYPVPSDSRITVEEWEDYIILQCCFGSLVNKTLARMLGHLLSDRIGQVVGVQEDPYRIVIRTEKGLKVKDVLDVLHSLTKSDIDSLAVEAVTKTGIFKRRLIHVARKFGALSKQADFSTISLKQLLDGFKGTVIFDEALKDTLNTDMDLENTKEVLKRIEEGSITITPITNLKEATPTARIGVTKIGRKTDLIPPEKMRSILVKSARARLLNEAAVFVCTNCWKYLATLQIKGLPSKLRCPHCGSAAIGMAKDAEDSVRDISERKVKTFKGKEEKLYRYILDSAKLISSYGSTAALALAGHGLRPEDIEDLLIKVKRPDEEFFEGIIEAEKKALRRRFW
ncbi:MAG: DEAD/DEAH box helicase [Candidatus Bathyarchaeia archaeon]